MAAMDHPGGHLEEKRNPLRTATADDKVEDLDNCNDDVNDIKDDKDDSDYVDDVDIDDGSGTHKQRWRKKRVIGKGRETRKGVGRRNQQLR